MENEPPSDSTIELDKNQIRTLILYNFLKKLSQKQCLEDLQETIGCQAPSFATICRWYLHFKRQGKNVKVVKSGGRPVTATTDKNVSIVREMIERDPRVTVSEIIYKLKIGSYAVQKILHEKLRVKKKFSRWIPHSLTQEQKQLRASLGSS